MRMPGSRILNRPYYVYRPTQLLRRVVQLCRRYPADVTEVTARLPWGLPLAVNPREGLGRSVLRNGVAELVVSEALRRLCLPGDTAIDVGAHIGYMTALLTTAVGAQGTVAAFEPHPLLFRYLEANIDRWRDDPRTANVHACPVAVSDTGGKTTLMVPSGFEANMGLSTLEGGSAGSAGVEVARVRLDDVVSGPVGVAKIDVEGHEAAVFRGAVGLLQGHAIRDIVFEHHDDYPSPVTDFLESFGYQIVGLEQHPRGPRAVDPSHTRALPFGGPNNLVATVESRRLEERLRPRGWQVLRR
jgi:FkbM family methyltransferase